jgi:hypothetical protein
MKYSLILVATILLLCGGTTARPQGPQITAPSPTPTIPQNYLDTMNRQEVRLDQIDSRMSAIETSLADFKSDTQSSLASINAKLGDMSSTNIAMKLVVWIIVLLIPSLLAVWYSDYLKRRRAPSH